MSGGGAVVGHCQSGPWDDTLRCTTAVSVPPGARHCRRLAARCLYFARRAWLGGPCANGHRGLGDAVARPCGALSSSGTGKGMQRSRGRLRRPQRLRTAPCAFHRVQELDQRPERPRALRRRVSPLLPAQPQRQSLGQHVLGPRRESRPLALDAFATRARSGRRGPVRFLGIGGDGLEERFWASDRSRPTTNGRNLHERLSNQAVSAAPGFFNRPRPHLLEAARRRR
mmetsp:Transcript_76595/g.212783  ORF Transcript_76595/g.212783 Transcript_76595/m.212783 type:complete len:227 (-) Transcript_76595:1139-1819(-)